MTTAAPTPAVIRADARRNRALILTAAQRAFAEHGIGVSLVEIARRAGVGAGTVHRHFPSKLDLLEAVVQQRVDRLTALAVGYRDAADPGAAFLAFCTEVIATTPGHRALCDVLEADDGWPRTLVHGAGERFRRAVEALLVAAQRQGAIRSDLTLGDVQTVFTGGVAMQRVSGRGRALSRPAALLLEAMRADGRGVTKLGTGGVGRNESGVGNETSGRCPICDGPLRQPRTGRPARYCSAACRQKAHRRRARAEHPDSGETAWR
ncbi:TetR/AcrR family transcriptional regulator [Nocardia terpenica]|uniref:TetR family transcriptional regulator n=1 Tax=Nocardia terpenica TaxID=455432 RepID=A0A6G9Z9L4_9NOCA|nr:TetR/AcrR family transcriptional regulator [Nocardia terpenica]QIS21713.1 TetR family transcriptional regulator [Nocardia terpenica]